MCAAYLLNLRSSMLQLALLGKFVPRRILSEYVLLSAVGIHLLQNACVFLWMIEINVYVEYLF